VLLGKCNNYENGCHIAKMSQTECNMTPF